MIHLLNVDRTRRSTRLASMAGRVGLMSFLLCLFNVATAGAYDGDRSSIELSQKSRICLAFAVQSEHDLQAYQQACRYAKLALEQAPSAERAAYSTGLNQCNALIEMAQDAHRNVLPMAAWLRDLSAEFREPNEPPIELAIEQAFEAVVPMLKYPKTPQIPVIPRCFGSSDACDGVHENILTFARRHPQLLPIQNADLLAAGFDPSVLGGLNEGASRGVAVTLARKTGWSNVVLLDVYPRGEAMCPLNTAGAEVKGSLWDLTDSKIRLLGQHTSAALDGRVVKQERALFWIAVLLLLAVLGWARPFVQLEDKGGTIKDRAASSVGGVLLGLGLGYAYLDYALPLIEPLLADLDAFSFGADGGLRWSLLLYPAGLGALVYASPGFLCVAASSLARARVAKLGISKVRWARLVPIVQLGVCATVMQTVPQHVGGDLGLAWLAIMIGPPVILGAAIGRPLSYISDADAGRGRTALPLTLALVCWLIYLPTLHVLASSELVSSGVWFVMGLLLVVSAFVYLATRDLQTGPSKMTSDPEDLTSAEGVGGTLLRPLYVDLHSRNTEMLHQHFVTAGAPVHQIWLTGPSGAGKSRTANEMISLLQAAMGDEALVVGRATGEGSTAEGDDASASRTFGFATDALRSVCAIEERLTILEEREERMAATENAVSALEGLPGVDLLMGLSDEAPPGGMTLNWLAEDMTQAIIERCKDSTVVLFLGDVDQADDDSLQLLARIKDRLLARSDELMSPVHFIFTSKEAPDIGNEPERPMLQALAVDSATIALEPLTEEGAERLIACTGLSLQDLRAVPWLLENTQARLPGGLVGLLRHLDAMKLLEVVDGNRQVPTVDTLQEHPESVPQDLIECQRLALLRLPTDQLFVLEMAAQCGRRFTARSLAAGLEMKPLQVLKALREVELSSEFVHDEEQEDVFQFTSESVRRALRQMTRRRLESAPRSESCAEVVRTFHYQTAKALLSDAADTPACDPERLLQHCLQAGERMESEVLTVALNAAEHAMSLFAWRRGLGFLRLARTAGQRADATQEQRASLDFLEAYARKNLGGQDNRDRSYQLLRSLLDAPLRSLGAREYAAVETCLEVRYQEKERPELMELVAWLESWSAKADFSDELCRPVCEFYLALARYELDRVSPGSVLKELEARLREMPERRERDLLLARVLQSIADQMSWVEKRPFDEIEPYWAESLALKRAHGDLAGQALTLGTQGAYVLYNLEDPERAIELLTQDIELVRKMGDDGALGGLLNKVAMGQAQMAARAEGAERQALYREALQGAQESLAMAETLDREGDILFAALSVLSFAIQLQDGEAFDAAADSAMRRDVWEKFTKLDMMIGKYSELRDGAKTVDRVDKVDDIVSLINAVKANQPPSASD